MITNIQLNIWGRHLKKRLEKLRHEGEGRFLITFEKRLKEKRVDKNKDAIVAITGEKGIGKSTLGIDLGMLLRLEGMEFDDAHIIHGKADLKRGVHLMTTTRRGVFIFDEIIKWAYSANALASITKKLIILFTIARKQNHVVILNIPVFKRLVGGIRDDHVNYWLHIWRGLQPQDRDKWFAEADLVIKNRNLSTDDPWGLNDSKLGKKKVLTGWGVHNMLKELPGYICTVTFPPLPQIIEDSYITDSSDSIKEFGEEFNEMLEPKKREAKVKEEPKEATPA